MAKQNKPVVKDSPARTVHVPVIMTPILVAAGREKIDVVPNFLDFDLSKMNDSELTDQIGYIKEYRKEVDKWEKLAVNIIKARLVAQQVTDMFGVAFSVNLRNNPRVSLDKDKLIAKFGEAALADCYSEMDVYTLTAKKI